MAKWCPVVCNPSLPFCKKVGFTALSSSAPSCKALKREQSKKGRRRSALRGAEMVQQAARRGRSRKKWYSGKAGCFQAIFFQGFSGACRAAAHGWWHRQRAGHGGGHAMRHAPVNGCQGPGACWNARKGHVGRKREAPGAAPCKLVSQSENSKAGAPPPRALARTAGAQRPSPYACSALSRLPRCSHAAAVSAPARLGARARSLAAAVLRTDHIKPPGQISSDHVRSQEVAQPAVRLHALVDLQDAVGV